MIIFKCEGGESMQSLTTTISVQVDKYDKEITTGILDNLGLNMSIYVNMAIKQLINKEVQDSETKGNIKDENTNN